MHKKSLQKIIYKQKIQIYFFNKAFLNIFSVLPPNKTIPYNDANPTCLMMKSGKIKTCQKI